MTRHTGRKQPSTRSMSVPAAHGRLRLTVVHALPKRAFARSSAEPDVTTGEPDRPGPCGPRGAVHTWRAFGRYLLRRSDETATSL